MIRSVAELTDVEQEAWPAIEEAFATSAVPVEVLPIAAAAGARALWRIQVTTRSCLGALAYHSGGVLVDDGWLRILGGGHAGRGLVGLADANGLADDPAQQSPVVPAFLAGFDVLGGQFAVNGPDPAAAGRPGEPGQVCYYAPDAMEWEPMDFGHGSWLYWTISGRLEKFYEGLRWTGWRDDIKDLALDQGMSIFPFLGTEEAQDIEATSRSPVPITELFSLYGASPTD